VKGTQGGAADDSVDILVAVRPRLLQAVWEGGRAPSTPTQQDTMFGGKDAAAEFRIKVSSQMSQRGGEGCGLGVDTERMALTHIDIYIFNDIFLGNINFIV